MSETEINIAACLLLLGDGAHSVDDIRAGITKEARFRIPRSTVSSAVYKLKMNGVVSREVIRDEAGRPRVIYKLSKKGVSRLEEAGSLIFRALGVKNGN